MAACLESVFLIVVSDIIERAASLVLEASKRDKVGEFSTKTTHFHFRHSYAMEAVRWTYLVAVMDSPCA